MSFDSVRPVQVDDSSRKSVADISSGVIGWMSLPRRELIRVDFTSGTDLRSMVVQGGDILSLHSYFCDGENPRRNVGDPGVYVELANANVETHVKQFLFFIDVTRTASPGSIPPEPGFDLSVQAEDICFYVTASSKVTGYTSEVARIPKAAMEQAFVGRQAR